MSKPSDWGEFPKLSNADNEVIWRARELGFASFWPSYPTAQAQADNTLAGAKRFLKERDEQILRFAVEEAGRL